MAYTLKTSGLATKLIVCVAVDEDGTTIKDFKGNAVTLDTGVAASVATATWKGTNRKYFVTTANGSYDFYGVRFSTPPTVDLASTNGMSAWVACAGADANSSDGPFICIAVGGGSDYGLMHDVTSTTKGSLFPGGGTYAVTTTSIPTDGTTKFSFGAAYKASTTSTVITVLMGAAIGT